MAALAPYWLIHFRLWNRWTEFNETWQEARSQCPLPSSCTCFSGPLENQDCRVGRLCLAEAFSTYPLKPLNGIQRIWTGSKISTSSTKFLFSSRSQKQDGWDDWLRHFKLLLWNRLTEFNKTWQEDLNVLWQVCVFRADRNGSHGFWWTTKCTLKLKYWLYSAAGER